MAARFSGRTCRFTGARAQLGEVCIGCLVKACRSKGLGKHMSVSVRSAGLSAQPQPHTPYLGGLQATSMLCI